MKIECSFYGCSCGCTPSEHTSFEGEEPDIYGAIASWAWNNGFTTHGDPFRKLSIPEQAEEILLKVIPISNVKSEINSKYSSLELKIQNYKRAAETLGIDLPDNRKDEIAAMEGAIKAYKDQMTDLSRQIDKLLEFDYNKVQPLDDYED